jgi:thioredoxin reductase (NADPH)
LGKRESLQGQSMTEPVARHAPIIIIGSGPAGYTAAIYAARAMRKPMLIAGLQPGGQLTITTDVENYPGFADVIQGPWLMEQMRAQAKHVGTEIVEDIIVKAELGQRPFKLTGDGGQVYLADSVIIATGAQAKWLGLDKEVHFGGHGVSACATCDGFFYRGKDVAVIGGGNSAVEEALYLAHLARKVTVIHRRDSFKAEKILQERLFNHPSIEVVWDSVLEDIEGTEDPKSVTGIVIRNVKTGQREERKLDGVFIAIGHSPATEIFQGQVEMRDNGYIKVKPGTTETNIPGVYAAGDVADDTYRQAVTAAGLGCMAALEAEKFLAVQELDHARTKAGAAA